MTLVTVIRTVPPPIIGVIGTRYDRAFETFEANLDWLETTGTLVERLDPVMATSELANRPAVQRLMAAERGQYLPLILINDAVVSRGSYLSRAELSRAVGRGQTRPAA